MTWPRNVVRSDGNFVWSEPERDDVFRVEWEGRELTCPRSTRLRMLEGIVAFANSQSGPSLLPTSATDRAAKELARLRSSRRPARSQILTSAWHVPLRWFAGFVSEERELYDFGDEVSIRYRTDYHAAIERVARAATVIDNAGFDESVVEQILEFHKWLEGFPRSSMVELDYSSVAQLFGAVDLAFDESADLVQQSIDALDELDYELAGERYAEVAGRWAAAQSLSYVN